ncbi:MAG: RDD family protein [Tyzzerella sp.]|nr:RDD family protein [Tyzzerella sp.]
MKTECLVAPKYKRIAAWIVDTMFILLMWCLMTTNDLKQVNELLTVLDPQIAGALDSFVQALFKMLTSFCLKWLFCQTLYFCLFPAIVGSGKTLGKLLLRLSLVDMSSLEEMSPSRLVLREFVGRTLMETLLIVPGIVSLGLTMFSKNGLSLRDRIAKTVVVQDTSYII